VHRVQAVRQHANHAGAARTIAGRIVLDALKAELASAEAELRAHMASWEYAFAMGSSRDGASNHPVHRSTRERTEALVTRCRDLRARVAEHDV
jgi:hypothetical protein